MRFQRDRVFGRYEELRGTADANVPKGGALGPQLPTFRRPKEEAVKAIVSPFRDSGFSTNKTLHCALADAELRGDRPQRKPAPVHGDRLLPVEDKLGPAEFYALVLGHIDSGLHTLPDQLPLEVRHRRQDEQKQAAGWVRLTGIKALTGGKEPAGTECPELLDRMAQGASEAVQFPDQNGVEPVLTFAVLVDHRGSGVGGAAHVYTLVRHFGVGVAAAGCPPRRRRSS